MTFLDTLDPTGIWESSARSPLIHAAHAGRTCIHGAAIVMRADSGWPLTVGALVGRHDGLVLTMREAGVLAPQRPAAYVAHAPTQLYRVTTQTGRTIEAAAEQPLLTRDGWTPLCELEVGEGVAVIAEYPARFGRGDADMDLVKLLAYLTARGTSGDGGTAAMVDAELRADFAAAVTAKGDTYVELIDEDGTPRFRVCGRRGARSRILSYLDLVGAHGVCDPDKLVPEVVFGMAREPLRLYLNRLFTVDADAETTGRLRYHAASPTMARQVQHLLARFGVVAAIAHPSIAGAAAGGAELVIGTKPDLLRFLEEIGMVGAKARTAERIRALLYDVRVVDPPFDRLGAVLFDRIVTIEATGIHPVFDLAIDGSRNFIASDFVVRSTT
jgi:replicative DNA helicase